MANGSCSAWSKLHGKSVVEIVWNTQRNPWRRMLICFVRLWKSPKQVKKSGPRNLWTVVTIPYLLSVASISSVQLQTQKNINTQVNTHDSKCLRPCITEDGYALAKSTSFSFLASASRFSHAFSISAICSLYRWSCKGKI